MQNENIRNKVKKAIAEIAQPNSFAIEASIAAYKDSQQWLEDVNSYINENKKIAKNFIEENTSLKVASGEATYLLWVDCESICENTDDFCDFLREKHKLYISKGSIYKGNGNKFIRINIACPKDVLLEGLKRLKEAYINFKKP